MFLCGSLNKIISFSTEWLISGEMTSRVSSVMDNWLGKVLEGVFGVEVEYEGR